MKNSIKISFGKVDFNHSGRKNCAVFLEVTLKQNEKGQNVFSVCGEVWDANKKDMVLCGQCVDSIYQEFKAQITNRNLYRNIQRLWRLYHLNDMNAGTRAQTEALDEWMKTNPAKTDYEAQCDYLKSVNLYEVPQGEIMYKYGHGWLYREIPESDLLKINSILNSQNS